MKSSIVSSRRTFILGVLALGNGRILSAVRGAVAAGRPALDFNYVDLAGKRGRRADFLGRVMVLEWLNPACPYVVRHYRSGNLPALQAEARAAGVVWLQINSMGMGDLDAAVSTEWQKKQGVTADAYIRDQPGAIGRLYGARTTPHLFVIAKDGTVAYEGAIDDQPQASLANTTSAHNYVRAALGALAAGKAVTPASTEPYGCEVKYASGN